MTAPVGYEFVTNEVLADAPPCKFLIREGQQLPQDGRLDGLGVPIFFDHYDYVERAAVETSVQDTAALVGLSEPIDFAELPILTTEELIIRLESSTAIVATLYRPDDDSEVEVIVVAGPSTQPPEKGHGEIGDLLITALAIRSDGRVVHGAVAHQPSFDVIDDASALLAVMQTATPS